MNGKQILGLVVLLAAGVGGYLVLGAGPSAPGQGGGVTPPEPVSGTDSTAAGNGGGDASPAKSGTGGAPAAGQRRAPFQTAEECRSCHEEVWAEWTTSFHGKAWTDPMVQKLSNGFRMTECVDCHAPQPIHLTGVDQRVAPRLHSRNDGVDCISCHLLEDGVSVAAGRAADTSGVAGACRPVLSPAMSDSTSCVGCHNQHETVNEVADSGTGKNCLDCHMEPVERAGRAGATGRAHRFPGSHSLEMHQRATAFSVSVKDGKFVARTTNEGGAHRIPTDARHRSYNVFITLYDEQGNLLLKETQMNGGEYRLYYRNQFKETTQIAHGESREATWPVPEGMSGKAVVRLCYALNPELLVTMDVIEVERTEIAF